jgi:hypothetical protein
LVKVAKPIAKLETAVAYLRARPKKYIKRGIAIAPPPTPPIVLTPLNTMNTNIPPISTGNYGKTGL